MLSKTSWQEQFLLLIIEWSLFLTLTVPFYHWAKSPWHLVLSILVIGVIMGGGTYFLSRLWHKETGVYFYGVAILACLIGWLVFSWPFLLSFLFSVYFLWRLFNFLNEQTLERRWWIYLITFFLTIILWFAVRAHQWHSILIVSLIVQGVSILAFEMLQEWRLSKRLSGSLTYACGFAGVLILGVCVTVLLPVIKWGLHLIYQVVLFIILLVARILFFLIEKLISPHLTHQDNLNHFLKNMKKQPKQQIMPTHSPHSFNPEFLYVILAVGLLVGVFFLIRKLRLQPAERNTRLEVAVQGAPGGRLTKRRGFFYAAKPPKDPIRLQVFQLQKKFRKQEKGRLKFESFRDWLNRIAQNQKWPASILDTYDQVRYGDSSALTEQERNEFQAVLDQLKQELGKKN